jgi:hypothetical protein
LTDLQFHGVNDVVAYESQRLGFQSIPLKAKRHYRPAKSSLRFSKNARLPSS